MAQDDIQGQVVDAQGNPVDGAIVELTKSYQSSPLDEQVVRRTTTDANGNYIFEFHPDGDGTTQEWHVSCYNHDGTAYVNSFNNPGVTADLPSTTIPDTPVHYWPMDEGSGGTVSDISDSATFDLESGAGWFSDAASNGGFATDYDGVSDYAVTGNRSSLEPTGSYTIRLSVRLDETSDTFYTIMAKGETNGSGGRGRGQYAFGVTNAEFQFEHFDDSDRNLIRSGTTYSTGWYEIAARYDAGSNEIALFVNGSSIASEGSVGSMQQVGESVYLGKDGFRNDFHLNGAIDWPVMWHRALSDSEMSDVTTLR